MLLMVKQYTDKEILEIIGERTGTLRRRLGMSQEKFATSTGLSLSTIQRFESGKANISLTNFIEILRQTGQIEHIDDLLPEQPESPYIYNL